MFTMREARSARARACALGWRWRFGRGGGASSRRVRSMIDARIQAWASWKVPNGSRPPSTTRFRLPSSSSSRELPQKKLWSGVARPPTMAVSKRASGPLASPPHPPSASARRRSSWCRSAAAQFAPSLAASPRRGVGQLGHGDGPARPARRHLAALGAARHAAVHHRVRHVRRRRGVPARGALHLRRPRIVATTTLLVARKDLGEARALEDVAGATSWRRARRRPSSSPRSSPSSSRRASRASAPSSAPPSSTSA